MALAGGPLFLSVHGLGQAVEPGRTEVCRSKFVLELVRDGCSWEEIYSKRTILSRDLEEKVLSQNRMYYEQSGQLLYLQIQGSSDSGGDQYGEAEIHLLSWKKEPLQNP